MLMDAANELAQENPNLKLKQLPTSVDLLNPESPALAVLATEHNQRVHYHSVIGVAARRGSSPQRNSRVNGSL